MLRSLYSGVSAIKVNQVKLDVIANNIANVGTTAFKSSRVRFKDMISQSVTESAAPGTNQGGVNLKQVGQGVQISGIDTMVGQGMMQPTSRTLDVAMDGEGYLMVGKGLATKGTAAYTATTTTAAIYSSTQEGVDLKDDYTVNDSDGLELFYTRDGALTLDKSGNLLNSDGLRVLGYAINDGTDTSIQYDSARNPVLKYVNANSTSIVTNQTLVPLVIPDTINIAAANAAPLNVRITSYSIEKDGQIKAVLEDGKVAVLGQIATSSFKNPAGLAKVGGNLYESTSNSGAAVVRTGSGAKIATGTVAGIAGGTVLTGAVDNSKSYGDMLSGMLEMSNVDLAESFTDMIITTRAFQAAGKTITTGDEILQEIINLKR